jgi:hypothetical protein
MKEQLELFPTEVGYELSPQEELQQQEAGSIDTTEINVPEAQPIADAEWCFQFFNNEPIVFAWSNEGEEPAPLILQLQPTDGEGLNFQQNGMTFRIFPRQISEETKQQRQEKNASQNKEA